MKKAVHINVEHIGKKFNQRWIFKDISFEVPAGSSISLIGSNGSGKSTLLKILAGQLSPSIGKVVYTHDVLPIAEAQKYHYLSWSSPASELFADLNLSEAIKFHFKLKSPLVSLESIPSRLGLERHKDKALFTYSSGMLQKVKLGLALFSSSAILMLDEPTSFMDTDNRQLSLELIENFSKDRSLILASNIPDEWALCKRKINL